MDFIPISDCQICRDFGKPYSVGFIDATVVVCACGNLIKITDHPAIHLGSVQNFHLMIIPFPGCTVCGRPTNMPLSLTVPCISMETNKEKMREIYHNYGARN